MPNLQLVKYTPFQPSENLGQSRNKNVWLLPIGQDINLVIITCIYWLGHKIGKGKMWWEYRIGKKKKVFLPESENPGKDVIYLSPDVSS